MRILTQFVRSRGLFAIAVAAGLWAVLMPGLANSQQKSVRPGVNKPFENPDVSQFVERFEREGRDVYDSREQIIEACKLKPGEDVADIGAGTGLFTRLLAAKIGPAGILYAVDIAEPFLKNIEKTCRDENIKNVSTVLCTPVDSKLAPNSVDLVFICDTYHHFEYPQRTLASIHRALRPGGQLILIDFQRIEGVSSAWILGHLRAGKEVFVQEIKESGFRQVEELDFLKDSYFVRFEKKIQKKQE